MNADIVVLYRQLLETAQQALAVKTYAQNGISLPKAEVRRRQMALVEAADRLSKACAVEDAAETAAQAVLL